MKTDHHTIYRGPYLAGVLLNAISMTTYLLSSHRQDGFSFFSQAFFLNYGMAITYLVILFFSKMKQDQPRARISRGCWINVVILFTISAFSLNQEMNVFARFPEWLNIYTLLSIPLFLVFPYYAQLPRLLKLPVLFLSGAAMVLSIYMFLYLLPLFPISCLGLIVLGISIHSFVPSLWLWVLLDFVFNVADKGKWRYWIGSGMLVPIIVLSVYLYKWQGLQTEIKDIVAEKNIELTNRLPNAIVMAQRLPADALTDEILIAAFRAQQFWENGFSFEREGGSRYHNPLSTIALALFGEVGLNENEVESILNIRRDYRHKNMRKLWTGTSLSTAAISTNIRVFPQYRMAYHEKTIIIHHDPDKYNRDNWFTASTQEALYSFHVPEGCIVTSLSLWINGKEEKSRLSTVQKADSAYKRIVGVEQRDPAVVHWKEGNVVTVNVFPCTPAEDRQFKIGFTTPLKVKNDEVVLENIWFEGPDYRQAREVTQVILEKGTKLHNNGNILFEQQTNGSYIRKGAYEPYWQMNFAKPPLTGNSFCFGGYQYKIQEAKPGRLHTDVKAVFLDITSAWTRDDFEELLKQLKSKTVYAWLPEKTEVTADNKEQVWNKTSKYQFSVPFIYNVEQPDSSVIITKTTHRSPVLADLKHSDISEAFTAYLSLNRARLNVINIGSELSPFWRSLRELRLINYSACDKNQAGEHILKGELDYYDEDTTKVVVIDSHMAITKTALTDTLKKSSAPDHLLRLFAYNDVLRKVGKGYFEKEKYENELFREAEEAYVVSPVTSMIVLENETDYKRMGIHKNSDTVGNASIVGGGAVPEPHEWLLIALVAFFIARYLIKQKQAALH